MHIIPPHYLLSPANGSFYVIPFQTGIPEAVSRADYSRKLFGQDTPALGRLLGPAIALGDERIYSAHFQRADLNIHDLAGNLIERRQNFFDGYPPYGLAWRPGELWAATGAGQVLICVDLPTGIIKQTLGTPYAEGGLFSFPESVCLFEDDLYVAEMGRRQVRRINPQTLETLVWHQMEEAVWDFQKCGQAEIMQLESGYRIFQDGEMRTLEV